MADEIGYDALSQDAMRGVVRRALTQVKTLGHLPGEHHFYISFKTKANGVTISPQLAEKFPNDMTIVVQYQYWDLVVEESFFEIVLKFSGAPEHLHIPYAALTRFVDPSVNFGLAFDVDQTAANETSGESLDADKDSAIDKKDVAGTVVSLEAFRRKTSD